MCSYHGALLLFFSSMFAFSPRVCVRVCVSVCGCSQWIIDAQEIYCLVFLYSADMLQMLYSLLLPQGFKKKQADTEGRRGGTENEEKE